MSTHRNERKRPGHTPGPWRIESVEDGAFYSVVAANHLSPDPGNPGYDPFLDHDLTVAQLLDGEAEEVAANARLIAAAPDLLEACEALLARPGEGADPSQHKSEARAKARAALARATGPAPASPVLDSQTSALPCDSASRSPRP